MNNLFREIVGRISSPLLGLHPVERRLLVKDDCFVTKRTSPDELKAFIRKMHPVKSSSIELIRLGADRDGGYLVPDDLGGVQACFSPGVSFKSKFELDCAERGLKIFLADASVDEPGEMHPSFSFEKKFIGSISDDVFMTMDEWVGRSMPEDSESDLMLQMDIEGAEWEVLHNISGMLLQRFRIIVVELHGLQQLWSAPFFSLASRALERVLKTHACVHIHPNNCSRVMVKDGIGIAPVVEVTFLRRDRFEDAEPAVTFPHSLDRDNVKGNSLVLPRNWYGILNVVD